MLSATQYKNITKYSFYLHLQQLVKSLILIL